jgi:RNA polymerase sigma factor (sigma-70 family)
VPAQPFEDIVAEHGPVVWRVCRAMLNAADADDAWAETFLSALEAYPRLRPDSNVRGWLVTIAYRKAIDHIRVATRITPTETTPERAATNEPAPDAIADTDESLRTALDALPPKQRGAVISHYLADLPYSEVGALLETSEAAARRSAADGIANLRKTYRKGLA